MISVIAAAAECRFFTVINALVFSVTLHHITSSVTGFFVRFLRRISYMLLGPSLTVSLLSTFAS